MEPGEVIIPDNEERIRFNDRQPPNWPPERSWRRTVRVRNDGDRAIQVGSHFHFYEANSGFAKDSDDPSTKKNVGYIPKGLVVLDDSDTEVDEAEKQELTRGYRLDIPAGTAWRFEPTSMPYTVPLVGLSGEGTVWGLSTQGTLNGYQWTPASATQSPTAAQAGSATQGTGSGSTRGGA
jgi:urease subunit beta